ncbi:MAG TPA: hypothetical protein P5572_20595 [Phycisphaerae bacterium]|nr:hypothetical protein [Phycisphaerae bacterium]
MQNVRWNRGGSLAVLKIGGSVLRSLDAYRRCAEALERRLAGAPDERLIVVVSARYGVTNRLARLADALAPEPDAGIRDLLWSTGETNSVALLTLALHRRGVEAEGLSVHECGLRIDSGGDVHLEAQVLWSHLAARRVVVVPGFFALGANLRIVSLGRGGSDLTAVAVAAGVGAARCELIKDVGGYFSADPRCDATAAPIQELSYTEALARADAGCPVVQREALALAARHGVVVRIGALDGCGAGTTIRAGDAACPQWAGSAA